MNKDETLFNPIDDSLEARIKAYQRVYQDWVNAEASMRLVDDQEWSNTLGDREEVEEALNITQSSLEHAVDSFTQEEILIASKARLLEVKEVQELLARKRHEEFEKLSKPNNQDADNLDYSR